MANLVDALQLWYGELGLFLQVYMILVAAFTIVGGGLLISHMCLSKQVRLSLECLTLTPVLSLVAPVVIGLYASIRIASLVIAADGADIEP